MRKIILTILLVITSVSFIDAQSWSTVGPGIGSDYDNLVRSLATYNGELYAGGYFNTAGDVAANNIAKWNGANWSPVNMGTNGTVNALTVHDGNLYAGGSFSLAGGIPARAIAKWNGVSWSNVGNSEAYDVKALVPYNGDLYASGFFDFNIYGTSIAKWDDNNWTSVGPQDSLYDIFIECMAVYNGELYAAGAYYQIGGGGVAEFYRVIKWNGSTWNTVVTIPAGYTLDGAIGDILCMTVYNGELFIAGMFGMAIDSNTTALQIAKWNGTYWSAVGSGVKPASYPWGGDSDASGYSYVKSLGVYNGALYATGRFDSCGSIGTNNIAKWNGTNWTNLNHGINGPGYSLLGTDTCLFVGGWFNSVEGSDFLPAKRIAKWKDSCAIPAPPQATIIHGNTTVCQGSTQTYFIDTIPGAISYSWILPTGWIGNSNSSTITAITGSNGGEIKVIAINSCGNSAPKTMAVTVNTVPTQLSEINGNDVVCVGNTVSYSTNQSSDTFYTWNLPQGWMGTSTTSNITAIAGTTGGIISVTASNSCGSSNTQTLLIVVKSIPTSPLFINGNDTVCEGSFQSYFIDPVPGATGYAWDLTFGSAVGFDSTSIAVTTLYSGYPDDFITVSAYNNCGNSDMLTLPVKVNTLPYQPNGIFGNNLVCRGSDQTYFIDPQPNATSYTWITPPGWIGNSNTSTINVTVGNNTDIIQVKVNNSCGSGPYATLPVLTHSIPAKPGAIEGNTYVIKGEKETYSIDAIADASSYNWSLNGGGNITVGQNSNKVEIDWQTPGTYVLSVYAVNNCGASTEQKKNITVSGINEKDPYDLQLFPNPSTGKFSLRAKRLQHKWVSVEIINMSGQLVFTSTERIGSNDYSQLIDLNKLAQGIYSIKVIVDSEAFIKQVVIAR